MSFELRLKTRFKDWQQIAKLMNDCEASEKAIREHKSEIRRLARRLAQNKSALEAEMLERMKKYG